MSQTTPVVRELGFSRPDPDEVWYTVEDEGRAMDEGGALVTVNSGIATCRACHEKRNFAPACWHIEAVRQEVKGY